MRDKNNAPRKALALLHAQGRRITPQRKLILRVIQEQGGHISADEIYHSARQQRPRLSLSTVYRTLDLFRELDLVRELHLDGGYHRYEMQEGEEHHHMLCLGCGQVIEFRCAHCAQIHQDLADRHGFRITGSRVELLGYCERCSARLKGSA